LLLLKSHLQLVDCQVSVRVCVNLLEELTQMVDLLLRQLSRYVGRDESFELNGSMTTFENLEKFLIFLKSSIKLVAGS